MEHDSLARRALEAYPMEFIAVEYLAQSGNTVFKVTDSDRNSYSLHLNISKNNALDSRWTGLSAISSQLMWISALSEETDISVPYPFKNKNGEFISDIDGVLCTLQKWLDGEQKPYVQTRTDAEHLGELIGKLHRHASGWEIPEGFERPVFDSRCIISAIEALEFAESFHIRSETINTYKEAAKKLIGLLDSLEKTNKAWGLIHSDIIPPNFLFYNDEVKLIDFGACGCGFFLWDIAILFTFTPLSLRQAVFDSYSRYFSLPDNYVELTEAFYVGANIDVLSFYLKLEDAAEWLPSEMDKLAAREFLHYINNESFLFEGKPFWEKA